MQKARGSILPFQHYGISSSKLHMTLNWVGSTDALDECESSRDQRLRQIDSHFSSVLTKEGDQGKWINLKLIFTSRPSESIRSSSSRFTIIPLRTEGEDKNINRDIALYVNHEVRNLVKLRGYTDALGQKVHRALLDGADGMFLWVSLMVNILGGRPLRRWNRS